MKALKLIMSVVLALCMFTSCVSRKKYNQAIEDKEAANANYKRLHNDYTNLDRERNELFQTAANYRTSMEEKDRMIRENERKAKALDAMLNEQREAIRSLKNEVCGALKCFSPEELSVETRNGKLYVSLADQLLFDSGSDVVNARGKDALSRLAQVLDDSDMEIMVEGHTDAVPINTAAIRDNWDLSVRRATAVTRILTDNGISSQRIIASGRGEFHPVSTNATSSGRKMNRRIEIVLSPKLDELWKLTEKEDVMKY